MGLATQECFLYSSDCPTVCADGEGGAGGGDEPECNGVECEGCVWGEQGCNELYQCNLPGQCTVSRNGEKAKDVIGRYMGNELLKTAVALIMILWQV